MSRTQPEQTPWDDIRRFAAGGVIVIAGVAFATLLRPSTAYAGLGPALVAIAAGAGVGVAVLVLVALAMRAIVRKRGRRVPLGRAMTEWSSMAIVLILFIGAAAAPHAVRIVDSVVRGGGGSSKAAEQADFRRWQQTVAPTAAAYISAIREDAVFLRGLPRSSDRRLPAALSKSARTLAQLRQALVEAEPRLPPSPELKRLTKSLEQGLVFGERAQRPFLLATRAVLDGAGTVGAQRRLRRLRDSGLGELQRSQAAMARFSLGANKLGASLFAPAP